MKIIWASTKCEFRVIKSVRMHAWQLSGGRGAEAMVTWTKASVIGSQFLNPDPARGPCLTSFSEGCRIVACRWCRVVSPHNAALPHLPPPTVEWAGGVWGPPPSKHDHNLIESVEPTSKSVWSLSSHLCLHLKQCGLQTWEKQTDFTQIHPLDLTCLKRIQLYGRLIHWRK